MKYRLFLILFALLGALALLLTPAHGAGPENVLVIINGNSAASKEIGAYYVAKRKIPAQNVCRIKCTTEEITNVGSYVNDIEKPVKAYIAKAGLKNKVSYLVLTKGVPINLGGYWSVDSALACMDYGLGFDNRNLRVNNPYFEKKEKFSRGKYNYYLATRLDGYTVKEAKALVDRSLAAKPEKGVFLIDTSPGKISGGYRLVNEAMKRTHTEIIRKGYLSTLHDSADFAGGFKSLMGYFSWGSNDGEFDVKKYRSNEFLPGSIAETAVSTSARTFKKVNDGGQSLIADLIESGVTGVKGYVTEPTLAAVADPSIMFDRYLSGYNLAESFYMASRYIFWRDIVIGDPLCAPYAKK